MTKRQWTTPEQFDWLQPLLVDFVDARHKKRTAHWLNETWAKWEKKWPVPQPTAEEITQAGGDIAKAFDTKKKALESVSRFTFAS